MAQEKLVLLNCSVYVDGTQLTERAKQVSISESADQIDATTFGGNGYREFEQGLKTGEIQVTFVQGFDAGGAHATLYPLWTAGDEFEIRIGPHSDSGSTTNPVYVAPVKMFTYNFLQGEIGNLSENPVTFQLTGPPTLNTT